MKFKFDFFFLLALTIVVILVGCDHKMQPGETTVAVIDHSYKVSFDELQQYIYDNFFDKIYKDKTIGFGKALDAIITNRLKCIDFFALDLNNNQQLVQSIQRNISEELIVKYFEKEYSSKYTNEEFVRNIYNSMGKEVEYRRIVIYKPENASTAQLDSLKKLTFEIKTKAEQGEDFIRLVRQYSQDKASLNSNGYMPPIDWKKGISNQSDNMVFNLKLGSVRILEDNNTIVIIKIVNINKVKLEPFDKMKKELLTLLKTRYYSQSLDEYERDKAELLDAQKVVWNEKALGQLIKWSKIPEYFNGIYKDTLKNAISNNKNLTILTYPGGQVDFIECLRLMNDVLVFNPKTNVLNKKDLKDFFIEAIRSDKIIQKARDMELEGEIFNPYTDNLVMQYKIVELYNRSIIKSRSPEPTDSAFHEFYQIVKDTLYYKPEKINLFAMIYSNRPEAEQIWAKVQQGTPFEKVTGRYFVKTFIKDRKGQIKSYLSTEPPFLGEAAFKLKETEVAGVIEYKDPKKGPQYAVIKCAIRTPEKQLSYDDASKTIVKDFQDYYSARILRHVNRELREKYKVKIYKNVITKAIKAIGKK